MKRREFLRLAGGAGLSWPFAAQTTIGTDRDIDGVQLPSDASVASASSSATDLQWRWAGVWVGAWNDSLRHILLVERIAEDGVASVVFAEADNPYTRQKAKWRRFDAVISGHTLKVAERMALSASVTVPVFTATYEMDDGGQLDAVFKAATGWPVRRCAEWT